MMSATLIDLRQSRNPGGQDLDGLASVLAVLMGEPFQFARVSYGDELTLHFGDLRPALSPKLKGKMYGAYVLGLRASAWLLKSGTVPVVIGTGSPHSFGQPIGEEELEAGTFVEPGSRIAEATPFEAKSSQKFGLQLRLTDGTVLIVLPSPEAADQADDEDHEPIELADWELRTPHGLLKVGPKLAWEFQHRKGVDDG
jgi:hypothetical protein